MSRSHGVFSSQHEETKKRTVPDRVLIARVYKYTKQYRKHLVIAIAAIILGAMTGLLSPYLHKIAIDQIILPKNLGGFTWWIPVFVVVTLIGFVLQYVQVFQMRIVSEEVVGKMRREMISRLQKISLRYFSEGETGRIMSRPTSDANAVRIFMRVGLTSIILDTSSILGSLSLIFFLNAKLAILAVSVLPAALAVAWLLGRFSRNAYRKSLSTLAGLTAKLQENLSGMKVIQSFVREKTSYKEFKETQDKNVKANVHALRVSSIYQPFVILMRIAGTALILWFGAQMVVTNEITIGTLVAFTEYQFQYFMPLIDLVVAYDQYQSAMAGIERIFDLIDTNVEVQDPLPERVVEIETINDVVFEDVTFGYDPNIPVVKDVSFDLSNAKKLAIVGPTGAGKSTMINLLARFYDPIRGRILVNGYDIKNIKTNALRKHIGIVLQDSFLFPMSVRDNIKFGKPEASDAQIIQAAKAVGAHEFIMKLPKGYDYVIQEGSSNISIGQRQLISFARTLLTNPKLLVLDEATSSIDPYTELVVQEALKTLLKNRLAIIIAHRLSTIRLCDEIIVIHEGQAIEQGTHGELMRMEGLYSAFYRMQFREEGFETIPVEE